MQTSLRAMHRIGLATFFAVAVAGCASNPKPLTALPANDPESKELEADRAKFREKKIAVIEEAMDLSPAEHDAFWREYYQYEGELRKLYDQRYQIIRDYAAYYDKMTNPVADNIAQRALNVRTSRDKLARKYYDRIKKATSAITAARFLQVENEINLLSDLKISSETPIFPKGMTPLDVK
jgi:hypothetical protein